MVTQLYLIIIIKEITVFNSCSMTTRDISVTSLTYNIINNKYWFWRGLPKAGTRGHTTLMQLISSLLFRPGDGELAETVEHSSPSRQVPSPWLPSHVPASFFFLFLLRILCVDFLLPRTMVRPLGSGFWLHVAVTGCCCCCFCPSLVEPSWVEMCWIVHSYDVELSSEWTQPRYISSM
jgi:hypothetical protein